jgi:hypothetical protein
MLTHGAGTLTLGGLGTRATPIDKLPDLRNEWAKTRILWPLRLFGGVSCSSTIRVTEKRSPANFAFTAF